MGEHAGTDVVGAGFTRFSEEHAQGQLLPRIVDVALARADEVVVADPGTRLTGAGLLQRAALVREAVLAHHRADDRDPQEVPVAVLRGHDAGAVAAVVGVVASGHPVVVLDPTTPAVRLRHYVDAAGATLVVSDAERRATAAEVAGTVVDPDSHVGAGDLSDHLAAASALLTRTAAPDDVAVIVYTSGSTGKPKGVACDHRSILHDTWVNSEATGAYPAGSVVAHLLPMAFSAGTTPTLAGLLAGSRLELFDPRRRSVTELPAFLREVGADVLLASPAILRGVVTTLGPQGRLTGLGTVTMAGETVHGAELSAVRRAVGPDCVLRNRYGSTETWLMTEYAISGDDEAPEGATPVGWAVPGARLQVELEDGTLADTGTGRVVLTSRWLGGRYWKNPEKTAEVFADNPDGSRTFRTSDVGTLGPDGCLRLLGRSDHSVKIRGLLVEPGEIDALLFAQPDVREALVVGRPNPRTGRTGLVAYVVPEGSRPQASAVRAVVRENLPSHMVPEHVVFLDALPRTERGKLDRSQLPEPPRSSAPYEVPRSSWEEVVHEQFCAVLELEGISIFDDFFELGGDSLAAEALVSRIESLGADGVNTTGGTSIVAAAPTVASFAVAVRSQTRSARPTLVPLRTEGEGRPLFLVAGPVARRSPCAPWPSASCPGSPSSACRPTGWRTGPCRTGRSSGWRAATSRPCASSNPRGPTASRGTPSAASSPSRWPTSCAARARRSNSSRSSTPSRRTPRSCRCRSTRGCRPRRRKPSRWRSRASRRTRASGTTCGSSGRGTSCSAGTRRTSTPAARSSSWPPTTSTRPRAGSGNRTSAAASTSSRSPGSTCRSCATRASTPSPSSCRAR